MTTLDYSNFPPLGDQTLKPTNSVPYNYRFPTSPVLGNDDRDGIRNESTSPQPDAPFVQRKPTPALQEETVETVDNGPPVGLTNGKPGESFPSVKVASTEENCPTVDDTSQDFDKRTTPEQEAIAAKDSSLPPQKAPAPSMRYSHSRKMPHHYKNHPRNHASRNHRSQSQSSGSPIYHSDHAGYYYAQPSVPPYPPPMPPASNQPRFVLDEYGQPLTSLPVQIPAPVGLGLGSNTVYGPPFCGFPTSMGAAAATTASPNANKSHVSMITSPAPGVDGTPGVSAPSPRFRTPHPGNEYADYYAGGYSHPYPHQSAGYSDVHRPEGYYYNTESVYDAQTDIYGYYHAQSQSGHPHHMQPHSPYPFKNMKSPGNINVGANGGQPAPYHPNFYYSPAPPFNPTFAGQNPTPPGTALPANRGTQPYNSRGNRRASKQSNNGYTAGTTFNNNPGNRGASRKNSTNSCGNGLAMHDNTSTYMHENRRPLSPGNDIGISPEVGIVCSVSDTPARHEKIAGSMPFATDKCEADIGNVNSQGGEDERSVNGMFSHVDVSSNAEGTEPATAAFTNSFATAPANISIMPAPATPNAGGSGAFIYSMMRTKYPGTNVYIRGLAEDTTDEGLVEMCKIYGPIVSSKAILEHLTGACRGFGFVMYADFRHAKAAISGLSFRGFQVSLAKCIPGAPSPRPYQNAPDYSPSLHLSRPIINNLSTTSSASIPNNIYMNHPYLPSTPRPLSPCYSLHVPTPQIPPAPSPMLQSETVLRSHETEYGHTEEEQPTVLLDPIPALNVVAGHFHPEREPETTVIQSSSTSTSLTSTIASFPSEASSTSILPINDVHGPSNPTILNDVDNNINDTAQHLQVTETSPAMLNVPTDGLKIHVVQEQDHLYSPPIAPQLRFTRPPRHYLPLVPCSPVPASATSTVPTGTPRFPHNQNHHQGNHGSRYNAYPTNPSASPRFSNDYQAQESFGTKLKNLQDVNSTNLYMSNLPLDMNEMGLENLILPHSVISCRILYDTVMGSSRGVGFARMRDREEALAVIAALNGRFISGSKVPLRVRFSDSLAQKKLKIQTSKKRTFNPNGRGSQGYRRRSRQDEACSISRESLPATINMEGKSDDNGRLNSGDERETGDSYVADKYPERAAAEETPESLPAEEKVVPATDEERCAHEKESADFSSGTEKGQKPTMYFLAADGSVKPYPPFYVISGDEEREEDNLPLKSRNTESENDLEGQVERLAIR